MKRFFNLMAMLALVALTFASCQKENVQDTSSQEADVTFTLSSPAMQTKAFADGQTVNKVHVHVYNVGENGLTYITSGPTQAIPMSQGQATYQTRLVKGQTYTFVFWADYQADGYTSPYTYDAANQTISVNYNAACNDERRDAFYAVLKNVTISDNSYSNQVTLKRPFAQLNFGVTTDDYNAAAAAGVNVTGASVKCTHVANALNLLTGTVSGDVTASFTTEELPTDPLFAAGINYKYVAMNYVLAGASNLSDITLTLNATSGNPVLPTYTNVPLKGNYRTNIVGELFTSPAEIQIIVDASFVEDVNSIAAANAAFVNGATNVNITNVEPAATPHEIYLPNTTQGVNITIENCPASESLVLNYSNAENAEKPSSISITIPNAENLTVNCPNSHVEINGVTATSITATTSNNTLVIGEDAQVTNLIIKAGAVEIYGKVGSITNNGTGNIKVWAVGDEETWNKAYNAEAKTIVLKNSFEISETINIGRNLDIEGNGFEISHGTSSNAENSRVINITKNPNLVLNFHNTKFTENATGAWSRGINIWGEASGSKILLDGCTVSAGYYALNFIVGPRDIEFTIKNGTIAAGWAAINCYANNSTFNIENSTLKGLNDKGESSWNDFATIVFDGNGLWNAANIGVNGTGNTLNVVNSTIYACSESTNNQAWIALQYGAQSNTITVDASTRIIDGEDNDQKENYVVIPAVGWDDNANDYTTYYDLNSTISMAGQILYNGWYIDAGVYHINNAAGLYYFEKQVNNHNNKFLGKLVVLDTDVDLKYNDFVAIGQTGHTQFLGTFDGQGNTINNLKVVNNDEGGNCATGLFGWLNSATVKNLKITGATITGHHNVGTIAGYLETSGCTIENCHVSNATISCTSVNNDANGDTCGGIVGHAGNAGVLVKDCTVTNSSISAGRDAGQVVGAAQVVNVVNCSATNVTVTANGTSTGANITEAVIGRILQ